MKAHKKTITSAIKLPSGLYFTSKKDFTETLFRPINGKTADGYYTFHKSKKHGTQSIRLRRADGEIFAAILSNGLTATARTVFEQDGKLMNLFGLSDEGMRLIGTRNQELLMEIMKRAIEINSIK